MTLRVLQKHLGHHQEQLSLFALPPNLDDTEDVPLDEVEAPVDVEKWQDEELSDISDIDDIGDNLKLDTELEDPSNDSVHATNQQLDEVEEVQIMRLTQELMETKDESNELSQRFKRDADWWPERRQNSRDHSTDTLEFRFRQHAESVSNNGKAGTDSEFKDIPPVPWGMTPETPLGKIAGIALHFHTDLVPPAMAFIKVSSTNESTRRADQSSLSDRIMREVVLKLDKIETEGNQEARARQKELMREANDLLTKIDKVSRRFFCQHPECGQSFSLSLDLQRHEAHDQ
jgi:hypothetical protein